MYRDDAQTTLICEDDLSKLLYMIKVTTGLGPESLISYVLRHGAVTWLMPRSYGQCVFMLSSIPDSWRPVTNCPVPKSGNYSFDQTFTSHYYNIPVNGAKLCSWLSLLKLAAENDCFSSILLRLDDFNKIVPHSASMIRWYIIQIGSWWLFE